MKAAVYHEYGPPEVLKLEEVEKPTPKEDEILVRVYAAPVNFGDLLARKFNQVSPDRFSMPLPLWLPARLEFGYNKPKKAILGSEYAGEVEAVGAAVKTFKKGDQVFGYRGQNMGAYAEYICVPAGSIVAHKPANMSYEQAAAVPYGALTALNLLRHVEIQPGQKVLIIGASGSIGSAALQLARHYGAEVTAVCGARRAAMVRALGAERVIDYTREDYTQNGERYDLVFDVLGKSSFAEVKGLLKENGRYLLASFKMKQLFQMLGTKISGSKKVVCALSFEKPEDLLVIRELFEAGQINVIVDRCFPLEQAAEAHRYAESGQKQGSVIIQPAAG